MPRQVKRVLEFLGLQTPISRITIIGGITLALYLIDYRQLLKLPTISLYSLAKIPSPSIGLTRAYWYLIHGKFTDAYRMNRLIYIVAAVVIILAAIDLYRIISSPKKDAKNL
jgi:hypothetical protein